MKRLRHCHPCVYKVIANELSLFVSAAVFCQLTDNITNLARFLDEREARVDQPFKHGIDDVRVFFGLQRLWKGVDPRLQHRAPAERARLQVDHTAATDRRRLPITHTHRGCRQQCLIYHAPRYVCIMWYYHTQRNHTVYHDNFCGITMDIFGWEARYTPPVFNSAARKSERRWIASSFPSFLHPHFFILPLFSLPFPPFPVPHLPSLPP